MGTAARRREGRPLSAPRPRGAGRVPMATGGPGRAGWSGRRILPPPRGPRGLSTKGAPPRLLPSPSFPQNSRREWGFCPPTGSALFFSHCAVFTGSPWPVWLEGRGRAWSRAGMDQGQTGAAGAAGERRARWGWHRRAPVSPGPPEGPPDTKIPHVHVHCLSTAPHWSSD